MPAATHRRRPSRSGKFVDSYKPPALGALMIHVLSLMVSRFRRASTVLFLALMVAPAAVAQNAPVVIAGPPAPLPPEVISRDAQAPAAGRATRLTAPLKIDGRLDERAYEEVPS